MNKTIFKSPDDRLDYDVDFSRWLSAGDSILSVNVNATEGVTVDSFVSTGSVVKIWLSGGIDGATSHVNTTIETVGGRTKEHCFRLRIKDVC
jgi:hypothetical protein